MADEMSLGVLFVQRNNGDFRGYNIAVKQIFAQRIKSMVDIFFWKYKCA